MPYLFPFSLKRSRRCSASDFSALNIGTALVSPSTRTDWLERLGVSRSELNIWSSRGGEGDGNEAKNGEEGSLHLGDRLVESGRVRFELV
jgi:hypothetical protein